MSDALKRLIEAIEAGDTPASMSFAKAWPASMHGGLNARRAALGSLDAAKALHDALLPGWTICIGQNAHHGDWNAFVRLVEEGHIAREYYGGTDDNGARAALLAILRAKLSEAENHPRDETSV